jgi:nitroreductase
VLADPLIHGTETSPVPAGWSPERAGGSSAEALRVAVSLAVRAPSVHNTQPWRWRVVRDGLDLYVDPARRLPVLDPQGREQTISCGASLQHARLALVAGGWGVQTLRFPDPDDPGHLARLWLVGRVPPEERDLRLADAASHRRSDRRPFAPGPVPDDLLKAVVEAAEFEDCRLHVVHEGAEWQRVADLVASAEQAQRADAAYRAEMAAWTGTAPPPGTGVPPEVVPVTPGGRPLVRDFGVGAPGALRVEDVAEHPVLAVLGTAADTPRDWLRAGEALGRVLLTATAAGLASSPISAPVEVPPVRDALREEVLGGTGEPQLLLRVGLPPAGPPPPLTPRTQG